MWKWDYLIPSLEKKVGNNVEKFELNKLLHERGHCCADYLAIVDRIVSNSEKIEKKFFIHSFIHSFIQFFTFAGTYYIDGL
jgi:hypothetical protein